MHKQGRGGVAGVVLATMMLGLVACQGERPSDGQADAAPQADAEFLRAHRLWQAQRRDALLAEDGWTGLVGLHWIELDAHYVGSASGMRLAVGPPRLGLLQRQGGHLFFTPERGVALTVDGAPMRGRVALRTDRDDTPTRIGFDAGEGELTVIERGGRQALRVRHAQAPARTGFAGLQTWPADPAWRVQGRFVPHPEGQRLDIHHLAGVVESTPNPGVVEFMHDGRTHRLETLAGDDDGLLLILADHTNGQGSFGAGRYLQAAAADDQGHVWLDFNRAYNPPCAFTPHATCPLPPPMNRLDLSITAGERHYRAPSS